MHRQPPMSEEDRRALLGISLCEEYRISKIKDPFVCGHCKLQALGEHYQLNAYSTSIRLVTCPNPECKELNITEMQGTYRQDKFSIYPTRVDIKFPPEVPKKYVKEYNEALHTISTSVKASAALSRHCLQMLLIDLFQVKTRRLVDQISEIKNRVSSQLFEKLDCLREIGNFGSHPNFDESRELYPVELEEAELCLHIIESFIDEWFVKPAKWQTVASKFDDKKKRAKTVSQ